ncbi:MAG: TIGR04372 family glycosyltransferase [Candidatus Omnitrophica bacterium]|nr:TIGR04372 family glycosyltransferase [Candidatus Omnitrophota bacterium]
MFKAMVLTFGRHIDELCEGGIRVFIRKIKNFCGKLALNIFAPLAVCLNINWLKAHLVVGNKLMRKYEIICSQPVPDFALMKNVRDNMVAYYKKCVEHTPKLSEFQDWVQANIMLDYLFWTYGEIKECIKIHERITEVQAALAKARQLDELNIMFIPRTYAYGSIGVYENLCVYIKAELMSGRVPKKMILLVDPKTVVNNLCYLNYWRRYVTIVSDPLLIEYLSPLEKGLTIPTFLFMPYHDKNYVSHPSLGLIREDWEKENRPPLLALSHEDFDRGWECLTALGLPQGAWFVCLHVRESGWHDNGVRTEDFRNADIETYFPSIKAITDAGGWVIRMGDKEMQPLPKMVNVVDYSHSDKKSDWMDVFLCAECRFFIGTSSGLAVFAMSFGVPVVVTNVLPPEGIYTFTRRDLFLPRLCWFKDKDRYATFQEFFSPPVGTASGQIFYDALNLNIIKNTSEEIKDLVVEMLGTLAGSLRSNEEDERLQKRFKAITAQCGKAYGDENIVVNARIGRDFLRRHAALLSE